MRFWFDEHVANGPLNGAMEHKTQHGGVESMPPKAHDKMNVNDITGLVRQPAPYTNMKAA